MGGEHGGAGLAARPGDDEHAAEIAFVRIRLPRADEHTHLIARHELHARTIQRLDDFGGNADVGHHHLAGLLLRRRQDERQLRRTERNRHRRFDAVANQIRRVGRHARRHVDGHDRNARPVDVGHDRFVDAGERGLEARPKERVDDQRVPGNFREVQLPLTLVGNLDDRDAKTAEDLQVDPGIAFDLGDLPDDEHRDFDAALMERARDNEAVAAVVALSAEDGHLSVGEILKEGFHRGDDLASRVFHENQRGNADVLYRATIGLAHLLGGEYSH